MKIYLNYENTYKEIYFNKIIFFHGNIDNQIKLFDLIKEGFLGSSKSFLLNNEPVKKKSLNVIEFSMNSIFDDLKFTSKSYNLKILESIFNDEEEQHLEEFNILLDDIQNCFNDKYSIISDNYHLKPYLKINDIKKVILDNFILVDKDDVNISTQIELEFAIIADYIKINSEKTFYLLVKHFDYCLDISQMKRILEMFLKLGNVNVIFFTKSFELYNYVRDDYQNYMVSEDNLYKYELDQDIIRFDPYLSDSENKFYQNILQKEKIYKDYCEITNEKF